MKSKKQKSIKDIMIDEKLMIGKDFITKETQHYKEFNEISRKFIECLDEDEKISLGISLAILIADKFDFNKDELKVNKNEYITLARDILYVTSSNPINDQSSLIHLIKALYGQTSIAYNQKGEHKKINLEDGNEWVDYLEKNVDDRTIKSYALTLRAFQYIVYGESLEISVNDRLKRAEKDLLYASKWDEENYLAFYCLGLLYNDDANSKYDVDKALKNFMKAKEFLDKEVKLDVYVTGNEKEKIMINADKKINLLK